ncbi:hypothetical protein [Desulfatibacillum aliphaticivorans]|uniref:hypothetical protein n=1 Tax=Desulfatibacillum aliphaticivorans TaxID=218208 RepID=UPI0012F90DE4|nr:hypothetical protein [Desulfatibacillum aliphaticivorans]
MMTNQTANAAQEFLTVNHGDRQHQIVNIELMMRRHQPEEVVDFLVRLSLQYKKTLARSIRRDRSDPFINELVARRFRIRMAINTIRKEVRAA